MKALIFLVLVVFVAGCSDKPVVKWSEVAQEHKKNWNAAELWFNSNCKIIRDEYKQACVDANTFIVENKSKAMNQWSDSLHREAH